MRRPLVAREVDTIYVAEDDRWVVSLIVGYSDDHVKTPKQAAAAALALTTDAGSSDTVWCVYDRRTGESVQFEQGDFEDEEVL